MLLKDKQQNKGSISFQIKNVVKSLNLLFCNKLGVGDVHLCTNYLPRVNRQKADELVMTDVEEGIHSKLRIVNANDALFDGKLILHL